MTAILEVASQLSVFSWIVVLALIPIGLTLLLAPLTAMRAMAWWTITMSRKISGDEPFVHQYMNEKLKLLLKSPEEYKKRYPFEVIMTRMPGIGALAMACLIVYLSVMY